ncbi:hypothetical protein CR513_30668, partial [Mucuna pruriens]
MKRNPRARKGDCDSSWACQCRGGERNWPCASCNNRASRGPSPKIAYRTYDPTEVAFWNSRENTPIKEVTNIAEIGRVTRSGRIYSPEALRKKTQVPKAKETMARNTKGVATGKEAVELLKLIRHSHYNLLLKILIEAHLAQDIALEKFGGIINNITAGSHLSFFEEEISAEGRSHNQPLHIAVKCGDYMIARVLINNGSTFNILPKITLDKLYFPDS